MTDDTVKIPDPHNVPVVFANILGNGGALNGVINFTLCVTRFTPTLEGKVEADPVIAARIRIDLETAVALRDFLKSQIDLLTAPTEKAN